VKQRAKFSKLSGNYSTLVALIALSVGTAQPETPFRPDTAIAPPFCRLSDSHQAVTEVHGVRTELHGEDVLALRAKKPSARIPGLNWRSTSAMRDILFPVKLRANTV
jgi:hypothetical protein